MSSMGEEALGPVKVLCPSIEECQGQEWEWVGWVSRHSGKEIGDLEMGGRTAVRPIIETS